jgi:hypothetical protein
MQQLASDLSNAVQQIISEEDAKHLEKTGYCLVLFGVDGDPVVAGIAHGDRPAIVRSLRDFCAQIEGN